MQTLSWTFRYLWLCLVCHCISLGPGVTLMIKGFLNQRQVNGIKSLIALTMSIFTHRFWLPNHQGFFNKNILALWDHGRSNCTNSKSWEKWYQLTNHTNPDTQYLIPHGLTARISGFHPGGPGSTPGVGTILRLRVKTRFLLNLQDKTVVEHKVYESFDSSVGRAVDCSW